MSRTKNSLRNFILNTVLEITSIVLSFIVRTFLINYLGKKYLGINGLFTSIISMLSLAELGIGTAIIYDLYKPIAINDKNKIIQLMNLYKTAYRIIAAVIFILGICILPFLNVIIKDDISFINAPIIFILFLLQSVSSYLFFAYKSSLIRANQKEYIISIITTISSIISSAMQIVVLIIFKNFTLFVITVIFINIIKNIVIAKKADNLYPFINTKLKEKLNKLEKKRIYQNCYATFIYRINGVALKSTDNILLSAYIGLSTVGLYSNYVLISSTLKNFLRMLCNAISSSIGNFDATETVERKKNIFEVINFITFWISGVSTVGFISLANKFITLWIGNEYLLSQGIVLLISLDIIIFGMMKTTSVFRTSMGLFKQGKYRPLFGIIVNLVLSIILVQFLDVMGVILGTIIANVITSIWYDPIILYKYAFKCSLRSYINKSLKYILAILISLVVSHFLCNLFITLNFFTFLLQGIICVSLTSFVFYLLFRKSEEFIYISNILIRLLKKNDGKLRKISEDNGGISHIPLE